MRLHKYQALGNDYLVLHGGEPGTLNPALIKRICHRHFGVGSDGILEPVRPRKGADFGLRIWNPDGSEAEKSGNGLRIFAKYLWDQRRVTTDAPFAVDTIGGRVRSQVQDDGGRIFVEMGRASFDSRKIPVTGDPREVVGEPMVIDGNHFRYTAVTVGNPHCVIPVEELSPELAVRFGPQLENHPYFPNRTNVQFVKVVHPHELRIEIWERGAGYTLASGSSSCAAAAACVRLGLCTTPLRVLMPGGQLAITVDAGFNLTMLGPAEKVAEIELAPAFLAAAVRAESV
ncbi:MAG: diaminopimelate epimerase [Verrucomicrobia bacterium]|nr:diaminopimelate epimerase [Verrucomicrobiota bacterium]